MKRAAFCIFCGMIMGMASVLWADVVKMNCNAVYPASNFHSQGVSEFAELVKKYTGDTVVIEVHPGGSLGFKGPELLKAVKNGEVPMSDILMGVVESSEKVFGISSLPLMVNSYDEAMELYRSAKGLYDKAATKWNQKILYVSPWPPSGLFSSKEIITVNDIKGLQTRTYDKNGADFLALMGANSVSLPWGEVYQALKKGLIDSVLTSAVSGKDAKFWEVLKYYCPMSYAYPLNMVTINLDYWNKLTKEQKEGMEKAAAEIEKKQWERSKADNAEAVKNLVSNGIIISVGGGANSENRYGIKVMAESGVLLTLDKGFKAELDGRARQIIDTFLATADGETASFVKSFLASKKK